MLRAARGKVVRSAAALTLAQLRVLAYLRIQTRSGRSALRKGPARPRTGFPTPRASHPGSLSLSHRLTINLTSLSLGT